MVFDVLSRRKPKFEQWSYAPAWSTSTSLRLVHLDSMTVSEVDRAFREAARLTNPSYLYDRSTYGMIACSACMHAPLMRCLASILPIVVCPFAGGCGSCGRTNRGNCVSLCLDIIKNAVPSFCIVHPRRIECYGTCCETSVPHIAYTCLDAEKALVNSGLGVLQVRDGRKQTILSSHTPLMPLG